MHVHGNGPNGEVNVTLTGRKAKVTKINASSSSVINAGQSQIITVSPTPGYMARLRNIFVFVYGITAATTGKQTVIFYQGTNKDQNIIFNVNSGNPSSGMRIRSNYNQTATLADPTSVDQMQRNILNTVFTAENPLNIYLENSTDANQAQSRTIILFVEEEAVV